MEPKNKRMRNLQTQQPNIKYPEGNVGWPDELKDQSNPVTYAYRIGKNGTTESKPVTNIQNG